MEDLVKMLWLLIVIPMVFFLARPLANYRTLRRIIIILHALILTFLTQFVFNRPGWKWSRSADALNLLGKTNDHKAYSFIGNNFILVDNSFDKSLILNPNGGNDDSTNITITDRHRLVTFLNLLNNNNSLIDLVVFDIGISTYNATEEDSDLRRLLVSLYSQNKLLLSLDPYDPDAYRPVNDPSAYGNISEEGDDKLFVTHRIKTGNFYSLPYKIYSFLNKTTDATLRAGSIIRESGSTNKRHYANNTFSPAFSMTDEKILLGKSHPSSQPIQAGSDSGRETSTFNYYLMSQTLSPRKSDAFLENLQFRHSQAQRNIIFIGAFGSLDEDKHQTMYGALHGPTIILNTVYSLYRGEHFLNLWYILILLVGFLVISFYMVDQALASFYLPIKEISVKRGGYSTWIQRIGGFIKKMKKIFDPNITSKRWSIKDLLLSIIGYIFSEQLLFLLLVLIILLERVITNRVPNVLVLLFYFSILKSSLGYAGKKMKAKRTLGDR